MKLLPPALLVLMVAVLVISAGADKSKRVDCTTESVEATISYANQVQRIFDFNCVICHQTGAANAGLNLELGLSYVHLVEKPSSQSELQRVAPGDVEASYLYHKLLGTHLEVGGSGSSMPLGGGRLPSAELEIITTWMRECALDN
jgi:mono/diheme cytochrome c family protein